MTMFHLLKIRTSIDIFKNEKCKVTFGLEYMLQDLMKFHHNILKKKETPEDQWSYKRSPDILAY